MGNAAMIAETRSTRGVRVNWPVHVRIQWIDYIGRHAHHYRFNFAIKTVSHCIHVLAASKVKRRTTSAVSARRKCSSCGIGHQGKPSCCASGGSWSGKCGDKGSDKEHTWAEGAAACRCECSIHRINPPDGTVPLSHCRYHFGLCFRPCNRGRRDCHYCENKHCHATYHPC